MSEELSLSSDIAQEAEEKSNLLKCVRQAIAKRALDALGARSIKYTSPDEGMSLESGFDCSGFVGYILQQVAREQSVSLVAPRHANEQWREFGEFTSYQQRKTGDLVFFPSKTAGGIRIIGHVGLILDKNLYIHAPGKPDSVVCIDKLPYEPVPFDNHHPDDMHTHSPAGIKRITLPIGNGRWHVQ
jgi:hypothetical protein